MKIFPLFFLPVLLLLAACGSKEASVQAQVSSRKLTEQGYELIAQEQPRAALAMFDQAIGNDEKNIRAYQGKAIAMNTMGNHKEADEVYEQALKIQPDSVNIINNFAMSKILQGEYQKALDLLTPLATTATANDTVMENMALANCLLGKTDNAKKLYNKRLSSKQIKENLQFCKKYGDMHKDKSTLPAASPPPEK